MPFAVDPNERYRFVFWTDTSKPEKEQPALIFRFLSANETRQMGRAFEEYDKAIEDDDLFNRALDALKIGLVGWENMGRPFDIDKVLDVLTPYDLVEIRNRLIKELTLNELDKKKLAATSVYRSGFGAKDVEAESATVQPQQSQQSSNASTVSAIDVNSAPTPESSK